MRKSRLWTAVSAVVGLAALVVLASCQGPVGDTGAAGGTGGTGPAGPAGSAGPADNAGPTAVGTIPKQYLVLGSTTKAPATAPTDGDAGYRELRFGRN